MCKKCLIVPLFAAVFLLAGCGGSNTTATNSSNQQQQENARPSNWAQPVELAGAENVFKVNDRLYRGAQPNHGAMGELEELGITTIVNLRRFHDDEDLIEDRPIKQHRIKINTWELNDEQVIAFLKLASDPANHPIYVHCMHGADRTGTMCAMYRVVLDGWTKQEAIREMTDGGFGFHPTWTNLTRYVRNADIDQIKVALGITADEPLVTTEQTLDGELDSAAQ